MEVADPRNTYHPSERGWNYWNLITWEPDFVSWLTLVSLRSRKWWSLFCKFWKHWNLDSVFSMGQNQRRQWHPTPVLLPGKSHGWRSLVGSSPWGRWVGHDWVTSLSLFTFMHWRRKWQHTPVFLPGESQGWGSLVGCRVWGHTESDTTEVT